MKAPERDELLTQLKTVMVGVENTEEKGLVGDVKDILEMVREQNGRQRRLATKVNILWGIALVLMGGTGFSLSRLIGG